ALAILLAGTLALAGPGRAFAHGVGSGQMEWQIDGREMTGEWSLDLRDARAAMGLDPLVPGEAGFEGLRTREAGFRSRMLASLTLRADSLPTRVALTTAPLVYDPQWNTVKIGLVAHCPVAPEQLTLGTDFFFDVNPTYRTYFSVQDSRVTSVGLFRTNA